MRQNKVGKVGKESKTDKAAFKWPAIRYNSSKCLFLLALALSSPQSEARLSDVFSFHLSTAPTSLRPIDQRSAISSYLLNQIYAGLMLYRNHQLSGDLAEDCSYKTTTRLVCNIRKGIRFSDGTPITSADFKMAFLELLKPSNQAMKADLLFEIENAEDFYAGRKSLQEIGIETPSATKIIFRLKRPNREFIFTLASPLLSPLPPGGFRSATDASNLIKQPFSGPFQLSSWSKDGIHLTSNPHYWMKNPERPPVQILFVSEDSVALNLYEKRQLSYLRMLPTLYIPKYEKNADYFEVPQFRFDYLGFGPVLKNKKELRQALSESISFTDLQKLFHAKEPPGCPGIPKALAEPWPCLTFKPKQEDAIRKAKGQIPETKISLTFSKQGGENHKRAGEWIQAQWKRNLGLEVSLELMDNKLFVEKLENAPPAIFRKGNTPERPTCLSALEVFKTGHSENYIRFASKEFDSILEQLQKEPKQTKKAALCGKALNLLISDYQIIPTGPIFFSILARTEWAGWNLNELNQLDLRDLKFLPR